MRIGHLSDLHLRHHLPGDADIPERRSREALDLLERALGELREAGAGVIAVTGDLVDIPGYRLTDASRAELEPLLRADYALIRERLEASGIPYLVVPGNHDDAAVMAEVFAMGTGVTEIAGVRFVSFWDLEDAAHVPQRTGAELALLDSLAASAPADDRSQVHLQHYVLTASGRTDWPFEYADREALVAQILAARNVRLALSGHLHDGLDPVRIGGTTFSTTRSLTDAPHHYRIYDLDGDEVAAEEHALGERGR